MVIDLFLRFLPTYLSPFIGAIFTAGQIAFQKFSIAGEARKRIGFFRIYQMPLAKNHFMNWNTCYKCCIFFHIFIFLGHSEILGQTGKLSKLSIVNKSQNGSFPLVAGGSAPIISFGYQEEQVVKIAATLLKDDIRLVTGVLPGLDSTGKWRPFMVIIGTIGKGGMVDQLISAGKLNVSRVKGQWETFGISVVNQPFPQVKQALVIAGSDPRGTAFGVFEFSKMIGVSPFYWWADIILERK